MEGTSSKEDFEWRLEADAIEDGVYQGRPIAELDEWYSFVRKPKWQRPYEKKLKQMIRAFFST